jgi:hypothetical protein
MYSLYVFISPTKASLLTILLVYTLIQYVGMQVCKDTTLNSGKAASLIHRCTLRPCTYPPIIYIRYGENCLYIMCTVQLYNCLRDRVYMYSWRWPLTLKGLTGLKGKRGCLEIPTGPIPLYIGHYMSAQQCCLSPHCPNFTGPKDTDVGQMKGLVAILKVTDENSRIRSRSRTH